MIFLPFVCLAILSMSYTIGSPIENLRDVLVYPLEPQTHVRKRETSLVDDVNKVSSSVSDFIEEKLIQHGQALEHLVKMVQENEEITKKMLENLSSDVVAPRMPEKVKVQQTRRKNDENDNRIMKLGKIIPKYVILVKDIIKTEFQDDYDPIPVVEQEQGSVHKEFNSRRSFNSRPVTVPSLKNDNRSSPWCSVAMYCRRSIDPVCGYDDNFGYGKFDDVCHMLQVNCYWKYNFALVPSCKPTF